MASEGVSDHSAPNQSRNISFPKQFGKTTPREYSFQAKWFDSWKWLHWDDGSKSALCFFCMKAKQSGKVTFSKNAEPLFVSSGFQNWKDVTRLFRSHELLKCHIEAVEKLVTLPATTADVGSLLDGQREQQCKKNREMLMPILLALRFFCILATNPWSIL